MERLTLTPDQVIELTGYKRSGDQMRWLRDHGWAFVLNAAGRPVISRAYAERRLAGEQADGVAEPSLGHIR
jgi:hypothetical protein